MGKSSLLGDFALNAAVRLHQPVIMFSLEMSSPELTQRFLASEARVDSQKMRRGTLAEQDWTKMSAALGRLSEAPLYIDDSANITLMEMRAKCRRLKARQGLGLVIIDYLQLMQSPRRSENRQQEVSEISRGLKILAKELEVPVMCASQLNRAVETRHDKRPFLGDLRESGCLTGESRVSLADGRLAEIRELIGKEPTVVTLDGWKLGSERAIKVWKSGRKPVFKLRTRSGRELRATGNHPFLLLEGWMPLEGLRPGDRIGIPRKLPGVGAKRWDDSRIILMAHLIGDGCYAPRQPLHYTTASEENAAAVEEAALAAFGVRARRVQQQNWCHLYLSSGGNRWRANPITARLPEVRLLFS
jgi:replicative DNA helicase